MKNPDDISILQSFSGRQVLLTGASGFVGKVWLSMMLSKVPQIGKIYVLVRKKKDQSAVSRFEELLRSSPAFRPLHEQWGPELADYLKDRLEVVEGDVSLPGLGIPESVARSLQKKIDLLLNCAGLVDFEPDIREAVAVNVTGAMAALEFAKACDHAAFLHISTGYVCGKTDGAYVPEVLRPHYAPNGGTYDAETEYRELMEEIKSSESKRDWVKLGQDRARKWNWPNGYTYTKSMAESLIQHRAGKMKFAILRPAIVESAMSFPFPGWNEGAETCTPISYLAGSWLRHITARPKLTLDIIPVDFVARGMAIAGAALLENRHAAVYHCASSDQNPLSVGRMLELITLAHRQYYREQGKTPLERIVLSRWDSVAISESSPFAAEKLRKIATSLSSLTKKLEGGVPEVVKDWVHPFTVFANSAKWTLIKAEKIIQVFLPFIYEINFRFTTRHLAAHSVVEEEFRFAPESIDWRNYIINIHEPGIRKWCYPILESKPVEKYRPAHPFQLATANEETGASRAARGGAR